MCGLNKPNARKLFYRNSDRACLCASVFDAFNPGLNWKRARGLLCQNSVQIRLWLLGLMSFHPYLLFSYHCNFFAVHSAYIIKGLYNSDRKFLLPYIFLPVSWSVFFLLSVQCLKCGWFRSGEVTESCRLIFRPA